MAGRRTEFETVLIIKGDGKGGITAAKATKEELAKLNAEQGKGVRQTEKYAAAQRTAEKDVGKFASTVRMGAAFVTQAAFAALGAIGAIAGVTSKAVQEVDRTAARLGVSTQSFMAQAEMARAAGLDIQGYGDVLKDVNVRVQEFATLGTGEAAEFFEHMNLDVREFQDLAPDQLIKRLGEEMQGLNRQERILFLDKLGSDKAVMLVDIITRLDEMEGRAIAVGAALSDVDAAKISQAAEGMDKVAMVGRGAANQMTAELAPIISDLSERFFGLAVEAGGFGSVMGEVVDVTVSGLGFAADVMFRVLQLLKAIEYGWTNLSAVAMQALASQADGVAALINMALRPLLGTLSAIADGWGAILMGVAMLPGPFKAQFTAASDTLSQFSRDLKGVAVDSAQITALNEAMQARLVASRAELDALLAAAPPSGQLSAWLDEVRAKAEELAQANVAARESQAAFGEGSEEASRQVAELIEQMEFENSLLNLTSLEQKILTNLRKLDRNATDEQREAVRRLTVERHREEEAIKRTEEQQQELAKARERQIENFQKAAGDLIYNQLQESSQDWRDYFDTILDGYTRLYAEFVAKNLASAIFSGGSTDIAQILGLSRLGTQGGGGAGENLITSLLSKLAPNAAENSGLADIRTAIDSLGSTFDDGSSAFNSDALLSGLKSIGMNLAASVGGSKVGEQLAESIFGKSANSAIGSNIGSAIGTAVAGPIGAALGAALGAMVDVMTGGDGKVRANAGFLVAPTPGAGAENTFAVDPFSSGLQVTGLARRADRAQAEQVIGQFRSVHDAFFSLVQELGGQLDLTRAQLAGLDEEATPGSSGTFVGLGGNGQLAGDLLAQINGFVRQLANHATGLSAELSQSVRAATSAEEALAILSAAVVEKARLDEEQARVSKEQADALAAQIKAEEELAQLRLDTVRGLIVSSRNHLALARSIRDQMLNLQGIAVIGSALSGSIDEHIAHVQELREQAISAHQEQLQLEQELFDRRQSLTRSLVDYAAGLKLGQGSILTNEQKLEVARGRFRAIAAAATDPGASQADRLRAGESLQAVSDAYLEAARANFASSSAYKAVFNEVLQLVDAVAAATDPGAAFDPSAANAALMDELASLQDTLNGISVGINQKILDELFQIRGSIEDLPPELASSISAAMGALMVGAQATGAYTQVIADSIPKGSLAESGANKYLSEQGLGSVDDYRSARNDQITGAEISAYVEGLRASATSEDELVRQVYAAAKQAGVGSAQLAQATGMSQQQIIEYAVRAGLPQFAGGGIATGPATGHLNVLHGTEAIIPVPSGFVPVRIEGGELTNQLRALNTKFDKMSRDVERLREITFANAQFSGKQRDEMVRAVKELKERPRSVGVGGSRVAKSS